MSEQRPQPGFGDYLTIRKAAERLGVSIETLRNWDRAGKLKPFRHPLNRYRLYRREDLEALLRRTTEEGEQPSF
jgi:MerR family transcriptional regulator, copper efflux regulator